MKKKVLIMNLTPRGGMLHYASQFSNELYKRKDIDMKVAIASYHNSLLYNKNISFIKIRTYPNILNFIFDSINIFYHIYFLSKIIVFKPDIVHFLDNHPWYKIYARIFQLFGYKIYTTQHDPTLHSGEADTLLGKIAIGVNKTLRNCSEKLFVHGDGLKKEVIEKYNISDKKVFSIKHGAYTFFNTWAQGLNIQKDTFLFFGRIVDYKGLDILLESLEYVKKDFPHFTLIIAGPGDLKPYDTLLQLHKNNIKIYNKNIEAEEAYKYFEISEFVVLPYKDATGSGVIPVAYSFEKAVLVSNVGELPSVVEDGKTGYILNKNNALDLGGKIITMLQQKEQVKSMGKQGKKFSDEKLSWKEIIDIIY